MSFTYRYRKIIITIVTLIAIVTTTTVYLYNNNLKKKKTISNKKVLLASKKKKEIIKENSNEESEYYKVDIKGEVVNKGLYSLKKGSRVSDVIDLAGGLNENSDISVINLSKKINDEMVIIIYSYQEVEDFKKTKEIEDQVIDKCIEGNGGVLNDACINKDTENNINSNSSVININTATKEEISTLSGIGDAKAEDIIKYREEHNGFKDINELKDIKGIGDAIFDKIKENITI